MMVLRVKHRLSLPWQSRARHRHMLAIRRRDVRLAWKTSLIETLRCFDDLVQPRCNLRWRHAAAEDIACRDGRAVGVAVGVLALDERCTLERQAGEET